MHTVATVLITLAVLGFLAIGAVSLINKLFDSGNNPFQ
jgi:hypothetical protein